ncbi:MAG: nucleoside-triphosphatase [Candidatus Aminicenantes bacterium]|nr:nucleoside-triphosphatase [Candidatus Aminicenantes bacterium]
MVIIIEGPLHAGKTTRVRVLVERLVSMQIPVSGYLSPSVNGADGIAGYDLEVIETGEVMSFLKRQSADDGDRGVSKVGSFRFIPEGLARAREILKRSAAEDCLVVDEVGPAELQGRGVWPELAPILADPCRFALLVVRESLAGDVLERVKGMNVVEVLRFDEADLVGRVLKERSR